MRREKLIHRAQSIIEYLVIVAVVISAFLAMGLYFKRSLQGKYRQAGDVLGSGEQYTPAP
jgi:cobalamin synthase